MPTVYYYRQINIPSNADSVWYSALVNINNLDFTVPSGYTYDHVQLYGRIWVYDSINSGSDAKLTIQTYSSGTKLINNLLLGQQTMDTFRDWTSTDAAFATKSNYSSTARLAFYTPGSHVSVGWDEMFYRIWFKKIVANVTAGDIIYKTDFDAVGWTATVGDNISHSGKSGNITASDWNGTTFQNSAAAVTGSWT